MATREPRFTEFKVKWHKQTTPDGTPSWYATMGGTRVAEASMTGRAGVDDYPWDWYLTDAGIGLGHPQRGRTQGVTDTLREAKSRVLRLLRP